MDSRQLSDDKLANSRPVPFLLITNGGGVVDSERVKLLSRDLGVELNENQLVQSHTPLKPAMADYADKVVLCIGGPKDAARKIAESYGLRKAVLPHDILHWNRSIWDRYKFGPADEEIVRHDVNFTTTPVSAIFVLHDSWDWGRDLTIINELMQSEGGLLGTVRKDRHIQKPATEIPLFFSNPDLEWKSDYPVVRLGMGAFSLSCNSVYKAATGFDLPFTQIGKPHRVTFEFAESMLRRRVKELRGADQDLNVYMIGDNPLSDIWGANNFGWDSILLRTGVYQGGEPSHIPTAICDDVELAVDWAFKNERLRMAKEE